MYLKEHEYDYLLIPATENDQITREIDLSIYQDYVDNEYLGGWEYSHAEEFNGDYCLVYKRK